MPALVAAALACALPLLAAASYGDSGCYGMRDDDSARSVVLPAFQGVWINKDASVIEKYFAEDMITHNPAAPDGNGVLYQVAASDLKVEPGRVVCEEDTCMVHFRATGFLPTPSVAVDIFRVENGQVVEFWDVFQEEVLDTVSGMPMFTAMPGALDFAAASYGDSGCYGMQDDESARSVVLPAFEGLWVNKDTSVIEKYFAEDYVGRSPAFPSERDALYQLGALDFEVEPGVVVCEGDTCMIHFRASGLLPTPTILVDIFRVENGMIVELWDVGQEEVLDTVSGNPMFTPVPGSLDL